MARATCQRSLRPAWQILVAGTWHTHGHFQQAILDLSVLQWSIRPGTRGREDRRRCVFSTSHHRRLGYAESEMRSSVSWQPRLRHALVRNMHTNVSVYMYVCAYTDRQSLTDNMSSGLYEDESSQRLRERTRLPNLNMHRAHATLDRSGSEA